MTSQRFLNQVWREATPSRLDAVIPWAEANVRLFGVKGQFYAADKTPWTKLPLELLDSGTIRHLTFIKPVQTGGSVVGEIMACRWIRKGFGELQWNWDTDEFALERWDKRLERILHAALRDMWPSEGSARHKAKKCLVVFPNISLGVQGVFTEDSLDSDSIQYQINEEVHKWKPGHLQKAYRRGSACAFPVSLDISNASKEKDQLHEAFLAGTQQHWEVQCPGCKGWHVMRTRWDKEHPELGGLRYDAEGARLGQGRYDYNKIAATVFFQMPCGYQVHDDVKERRALSQSGRWSKPHNEGALAKNVSMTYEAVTCHDISWLDLIAEKHQALRSLDAGDEKPWYRYLTERECRFYSQAQRPFKGQVVVNRAIRKNREGLANRISRFFAADYQKGRRARGELTHYWLVIRDVLENGDSQLVFEGQIQTGQDLVGRLEEHSCLRRCGVVDATWDPDTILEFCYRNGINAVSGSAQRHLFAHPDKVKRIYSVSEPIHIRLNTNPRFNYSYQGPHIDEPLHWFYHKFGLLNRLKFLRESPIKWDVPADVSEDYKNQLEAWQYVRAERGRHREQVEEWQQVREADHMMMCEAYIAMLIDMSGILGARLAQMGIPEMEVAVT